MNPRLCSDVTCDRCGSSWSYRQTYIPARDAKPRRLFGLLPARPARAAYWFRQCNWCDQVWRSPISGGVVSTGGRHA